MNERAARRRLKEDVQSVGSIKAWAESVGVSRPYASQMLSGQRPLSDAVLKRLRLRRKEVRYFIYEPL